MNPLDDPDIRALMDPATDPARYVPIDIADLGGPAPRFTVNGEDVTDTVGPFLDPDWHARADRDMRVGLRAYFQGAVVPSPGQALRALGAAFVQISIHTDAIKQAIAQLGGYSLIRDPDRDLDITVDLTQLDAIGRQQWQQVLGDITAVDTPGFGFLDPDD